MSSSLDERGPTPPLDYQDPPFFTDAQRALQCSRIYSPIAEWEIRILFLQPGVAYEPLSVELRPAALTYHDEGVGVRGCKTKTSYEALSYTWGEPCFSHPITISGHLFSITKNLHQALAHFRQRDRERALWVDAVCINQLDPSEKVFQIGRMLRIYRQAREVSVWLGEATASTPYAISLANQAERLLPSGPTLSSGLPSSPSEILASLSPEVSAVKHFWEQFAKCSEETLSRYQARLEDLLSRPWLRRIWVIQEVTASTRVNVHIGEYTLSWQLFVNLDLCWIPIDYTSQVSEVYTALTLLILNARQDFTLLFELSDGTAAGAGRGSSAGFPSWVPDYGQISWGSIRNPTIPHYFPRYHRMEERSYELDEQSELPDTREKFRTWTHQVGPALYLRGVRMAEIDVVEEAPEEYQAPLRQRRSAVTISSALRTSLQRSVLGEDSPSNWWGWWGQVPWTTAVKDREPGIRFREEARILFENAHLTTWLQNELVWDVPNGTKPGDLVVACGRGWPLILRRRATGGWVYAGYCKPTVPSHCYDRVPGDNGWRHGSRNGFQGFRGLTPLFQDICNWAAVEDFEHFEVF